MSSTGCESSRRRAIRSRISPRRWTSRSSGANWTPLDAALGSRDRSKGGRPPFDAVLKFRMLVLQAMHGLSLAQTEYLAADRLSWMRFCRLGPGDAVPDASTLWAEAG